MAERPRRAQLQRGHMPCQRTASPWANAFVSMARCSSGSSGWGCRLKRVYETAVASLTLLLLLFQLERVERLGQEAWQGVAQVDRGGETADWGWAARTMFASSCHDLLHFAPVIPSPSQDAMRRNHRSSKPFAAWTVPLLSLRTQCDCFSCPFVTPAGVCGVYRDTFRSLPSEAACYRRVRSGCRTVL